MRVDREIARTKIVTAIEALRLTAPVPNLVIEYDNRKAVNVSTATEPYLKVWINYTDGMQIGLGPYSGNRALGTLILEARTREGNGTKQINELLTHFYEPLQRSDAMMPVRTRTARHASPPNVDGWGRIGVAIPFWWDSLP